MNFLKTKIVQFIVKKYAKYQSNTKYPDTISLNLLNLLDAPRLKVAIIDDAPFPWIDALESKDCQVEYFSDFTKPLKSPTNKPKTIDLSKQDIVLCDIHKVGGLIFPGSEGIEVIKHLRKRYPFHVIAAYTGDPGITVSKLKKGTLDYVFLKDWDLDDFLLNFDQIINIYKNPKDRWIFLRDRLHYIGVSEEEEVKIRRLFVERVLLLKYLSMNLKFKSNEIQHFLKDYNDLDIVGIAKVGLDVGKVVAALLPYVSHD